MIVKVMVEYRIKYMLVLSEFKLIMVRWVIKWCLVCLFIILVLFSLGEDVVDGFLILMLFML